MVVVQPRGRGMGDGSPVMHARRSGSVHADVGRCLDRSTNYQLYSDSRLGQESF